jgi:hypothetical protein
VPASIYGLESLSGPHEAWWLNAFESEDEKQKVIEDYAKNAPLMSALNQIAKRKEGLIGEPVNIFAKHREGDWSILGARFLVVAGDGRGAVYEAPDGTRFVFRTARTLREARKEAAAGDRIFAIRPMWSLPAREWIAADPGFWANRTAR